MNLIKVCILLFLTIPLKLNAGKDETAGGILQFGMRSTGSFFGSNGYTGLGFGGQFRLMLAKRLNSEWFADYINTNLGGLGKRNDGHIGWSVMFYPFNTQEKILHPYLLAGHCFDYTKVTPFNTAYFDRSSEARSRWSSAAQAGIGTHLQLNKRTDITLSVQYMIHLGNDIHTHVHEHNGVKELYIDEHGHNLTLEGHLLFTLSCNIKIADLW